ncbi:MAG: glycoside hydrolase family 127 protein [Verrucomicrobia bacterium]|nr:glycoside hydrolase family 127 protein [Verrucomicrobiota bacterium]
MKHPVIFALAAVLAIHSLPVPASAADSPVAPKTPTASFPLKDVRLLGGPFSEAAAANREYLLVLEPDRLLAPFLREAGFPPRKPSYGNWESNRLDGHTAGHYLSALANMVAAGHDTDGQLERRLDYMLSEIERCQQANGDGYIGGVPGSKAFWAEVAKGDVGVVGRKWVPWYNIHKTYAGLRDAYLVAGKQQARLQFLRFTDWCVNIVSRLSDAQMQQMLGREYGGMNETLADAYAITGDQRYLETAKRFNHRKIFDPLIAHKDKLTGLHANTQIPKIVGMERIATLSGDERLDEGARFFWDTVTKTRSVAFGGNSVSEHFNAPKDFQGMLQHREGPETCNTYNMLRLTEQLFNGKPAAEYADYYERALFNHLLSAINPHKPGYVYFTPIRPGHYRVYSQPDTSFWCCVGTGMENPGRYGQFIYSKDADGIYVNLFIASELKVAPGFTLRQETRFPYEESSRLSLKLAKPSVFNLRVRHPSWVPGGRFTAKVNGRPVEVANSLPTSYLEISREWRDGDLVEVSLPMSTRLERLPDGSNWVAVLHGPIVLAGLDGERDMPGLYASDASMGYIAGGPLVPLDKVPSLLTTEDELLKHIVPDPEAGPFRFRIKDVIEPTNPVGIPLAPFFSLHDQRYQIYFQLTTLADLKARQESLAAAERAQAAREAATLDNVAIGEQQPEAEHDFKGEGSASGTAEGRRWRDGAALQYTLDPRGSKAVDLEVTYWGGDSGRVFDIFANGQLLATQELKADQPGKFFSVRYPLPTEVLAASKDGRVVVRFAARKWTVGGLFDLRLMKSGN